MHKYSYSVVCESTEEQIWEKWIDVDSWNKWDKDISHSNLNGEFKLNAKGSLKPISGPKSNFIITECTTNKSFTTESSLPFCKINFIHIIRAVDNKMEITHSIEFKGLLKGIFSKIIGKQLYLGLPSSLLSLKNMLEEEKI